MKYIANKGIAKLDAGYDTSAIMFGEAKEGAVEAHNFSSKAFVTMIHSKNMDDSMTVATERALAKSVFSMATSKVTSDDSAEDMNEDNDSDDNGDTEKSGVAIEGMHMLSGHCRKSSRGDFMQEDKVTGDYDKEDIDEEEWEHNQKEAALTKNMNTTMEKLN